MVDDLIVPHPIYKTHTIKTLYLVTSTWILVNCALYDEKKQ